MSGLQESCKEILQPIAGCIIILALNMIFREFFGKAVFAPFGRQS